MNILKNWLRLAFLAQLSGSASATVAASFTHLYPLDDFSFVGQSTTGF
jgi:hypothetical protein